MDILIKNMKLPKKGTIRILAVFSDGTVDFRDKDKPETRTTQAVEVPPHGRLIDADAFIDRVKDKYYRIVTEAGDGTILGYKDVRCTDIIGNFENETVILEASR